MWDYITLKTFWRAKETSNKMKRQPDEWEEIFASHIFAKWLIFKTYKYLIQLNRGKKKIHLKHEQMTGADIFPKKTYRRPQVHEKMAQKHETSGKSKLKHTEISPHTCENGYYQKDKK